jgi:hypothetical protein
MSKTVLIFDQSKKAPKIGNPPSGRVLPATARADVIRLDNLPEGVLLRRVYQDALKEMGNLNTLIEIDGGDPININLEKWWQKAYKNTRGHLEVHPSPEWLVAFHRGETDD